MPPLDAGWYSKVNKDPRPVMMAVRLALVVGTAHGAMGAMDGVCPVVGASVVHETERWRTAGPVRAVPPLTNWRIRLLSVFTPDGILTAFCPVLLVCVAYVAVSAGCPARDAWRQ